MEEGESVLTQSGGYFIKGSFRFEWKNYEKERGRIIGKWYCLTCNKEAGTEHLKPECNICRDWGTCGHDCTLSKVFCPKCGSKIEM